MKKNCGKIKTQKASGFLFVILLITLSLTSVILLFLASASDTIMFQANNVYLQACERNLISSGLSWARVNSRSTDRGQDANDTIQLDTSKMNILHSSLELKFTNPQDKQSEVQIKTSCGRARLNLTSSNSFKI